MDSIDKVNLKRDTVYFELGVKMIVKLKGDSVIQEAHCADTLYQNSDRYALRKFKGFYFLNIEDAPHRWRVYQLEKTKSGMTISSVMSKNDLENLQRATDAPDSITHFKPTKKEFKKLIKANGFGYGQHYLKVN